MRTRVFTNNIPSHLYARDIISPLVWLKPMIRFTKGPRLRFVRRGVPNGAAHFPYLALGHHRCSVLPHRATQNQRMDPKRVLCPGGTVTAVQSAQSGSRANDRRSEAWRGRGHGAPQHYPRVTPWGKGGCGVGTELKEDWQMAAPSATTYGMQDGGRSTGRRRADAGIRADGVGQVADLDSLETSYSPVAKDLCFRPVTSLSDETTSYPKLEPVEVLVTLNFAAFLQFAPTVAANPTDSPLLRKT